MKELKEILDNHLPLLFDGAMGTILYNKGIFINKCFEEANLNAPKMVEEIHQSYVKAGAQVLTTNSWGANSYKLKQFNLGDKTYDINFQAAQIAKKSADGHAYVGGSVGPLGVRIEPWGPTSFAECEAAFCEQIKGLVDGGIDLILLETFSDITEIEHAIIAARKVSPDKPIFAHLVIDLEGKLPMGTPVDWAIKKLDEWDVDVVGLNCSVGPQPMMTFVPQIQAITDKPISLMPNAGLPKLVDGRHIYMSTPDYMANFAKDFLRAGVQFIGGCCGTTPEHIHAMAAAIRHRMAMIESDPGNSFEKKEFSPIQAAAKDKDGVAIESIPFAEKSKWSKKIAK